MYLIWEHTRYCLPVSFNNLAAAFWTIAGTAVYMEVFFTTRNKLSFRVIRAPIRIPARFMSCMNS